MTRGVPAGGIRPVNELAATTWLRTNTTLPRVVANRAPYHRKRQTTRFNRKSHDSTRLTAVLLFTASLKTMMSSMRWQRVAVWMALLRSPAVAAGQVTITHESPECAVADKYPTITAWVRSQGPVDFAQLRFRSNLGEEGVFWSVDMDRRDRQISAFLPAPSSATAEIEYYFYVRDVTPRIGETPSYRLRVTRRESECSSPSIPTIPDITVHSPGYPAVPPPGFRPESVRVVLRARQTGIAVAVLQPGRGTVGDEPSSTFLGEAVMEEFAQRLSIVPSLTVISPRSESMRLLHDATVANAVEVGRKLGVDKVLAAKVESGDGGLRMETTLVNVRSEQAVWTEKHSWDQTDPFKIQAELLAKTSDVLRLGLSPSLQARITTRYTSNQDAYIAYAQGRHEWAKRTKEGLEAGIRLFQKAASADSSYALAYSGLADSYALLGHYGHLRPKEAYPKAMEWAIKALQLAPELAEPHASLGLVKLFYHRDPRRAEEHFARAVELNPNYITAHRWYAACLMAMRRTTEAAEHVRQVLNLDPYSERVRLWVSVQAFYERQYDRAVEICEDILRADPNDWQARLSLGQALEQRGETRTAIEQLQQALKDSGNDEMALGALGHAYATAGLREEALRVLRDLMQRRKRKFVSPLLLGAIHAALGQKDAAFLFLEEAYREFEADLLFLRIDPLFDPLRSDERLGKVAARLGV